jgi:scytalone dehydratase
VIAPELVIDYTLVSNQKWVSMTAADFIAMISAPGFLGDPLLKTQHLLGACEWEKVSDDYIIGHQQLRAGHLRFTDATHTVEAKRGHSHATNEFYYRKVNGVWKFAGLKPEVRWNEYEFETIFGGFECPRV